MRLPIVPQEGMRTLEPLFTPFYNAGGVDLVSVSSTQVPTMRSYMQCPVCPEDSDLLWSSLTPGSCNLSALLLWDWI